MRVTCACAVLVCLPVCGFVSGNRARTPARASASRTRASRSGDIARAADSGVLRPARPRFRFGLTRAPHESPTSGGYRRIHIRRRVAVLRDSPHFRGFRSALRNCGFVPKPCFCGLSARPLASPLKTLHVFRRLPGPKQSRAMHPRELGQGDAYSSLPSGKSATPPACCIHHSRHDASSAEYRLLALRRVSPRIRRTASAHVAQFGTRPLVPCLTFHKARFSSHLLRRRGKSAAPP